MKRASLVVIVVAVLGGTGVERERVAAHRPQRERVKLAVNAKGEALITYTAHGKQKHVLAWGASTRSRRRGAGRRSRSSSTTRAAGASTTRDYWKTFGNACGAYDGPPLAWFVTGCKAPDGSYWALQAWQRMLPNYGVAPSRDAGGLGAPPLALDRRAAGADDRHRLGLAPVGSPLRHASPTTASPSSASSRRRAATRSTRSAATSTSTRSTRRTARAGSARTASSRTPAPAPSVTASTRTAAIRRARARSTARRSKAPA